MSAVSFSRGRSRALLLWFCLCSTELSFAEGKDAIAARAVGPSEIARPFLPFVLDQEGEFGGTDSSVFALSHRDSAQATRASSNERDSAQATGASSNERDSAELGLIQGEGGMAQESELSSQGIGSSKQRWPIVDEWSIASEDRFDSFSFVPSTRRFQRRYDFPLELRLVRGRSESGVEHLFLASLGMPLQFFFRPEVIPPVSVSQQSGDNFEQQVFLLKAAEEKKESRLIEESPEPQFDQEMLLLLAELQSLTIATLRQVQSACWRANGLSDGNRRLDDQVRRARLAGLAPELRLRGVHGIDQQTSQDQVGLYPGDSTIRGGFDSLFEARLTFHLGELVHASEEVQLERLRVQWLERKAKFAEKIRRVFLQWWVLELALLREEWAVVFFPEHSAEELLAEWLEALLSLDGLSAGWLSKNRLKLLAPLSA
ncbi:MAG: hypothetical protein MK135_11190 [Polyangiaceae bacterium]|nr:hypothetical protein [Polyangiaceae bacterium]